MCRHDRKLNINTMFFNLFLVFNLYVHLERYQNYRTGCLFLQEPEFCLARPLTSCTRQRSGLNKPSRCVEEESGTLEQQHEATDPQRDARSKRTVEEAEPLEEAPVAKRVCVAGTQHAVSPGADDDIIDVETVSVSSAGEGAITGQVASDCGLGESEEKEEQKEEEAASSADEVISVGEGDCGQTGGDQKSSAGSPEDTDIDVIGGSSPSPAPMTLTWIELSEEEGEDEEGEVFIEEDCNPHLGLI